MKIEAKKASVATTTAPATAEKKTSNEICNLVGFFQKILSQFKC